MQSCIAGLSSEFYNFPSASSIVLFTPATDNHFDSDALQNIVASNRMHPLIQTLMQTVSCTCLKAFGSVQEKPSYGHIGNETFV
jgi:hypothetical protein